MAFPLFRGGGEEAGDTVGDAFAIGLCRGHHGRDAGQCRFEKLNLAFDVAIGAVRLEGRDGDIEQSQLSGQLGKGNGLLPLDPVGHRREAGELVGKHDGAFVAGFPEEDEAKSGSFAQKLCEGFGNDGEVFLVGSCAGGVADADQAVGPGGMAGSGGGAAEAKG